MVADAPAAARHTQTDLPRNGLILDLETVSRSRRQEFWTTWVPETFPGMFVSDIGERSPVGVVRRMRLGSALLWSILTTSQKLKYAPPTSHGISNNPGGAAILLQMSGTDEVTQNGRHARLCAEELTLIDATLPFEIEIVGVSRVALFAFPHALAKSRMPHLLKHCVQRFAGESAELRLFRTAFLEVFLNAGNLGADAANVVCNTLISLFP